jgi:hypothetical protein
MPATVTSKKAMSNAEQREWLKGWIQSGHEELSAQIAPETINEDERTVDIVWFSGIDIPRYSFFEGRYMLRFDPKGVDLSLLNGDAPILDNHWLFSSEDPERQGREGLARREAIQGNDPFL